MPDPTSDPPAKQAEDAELAEWLKREKIAEAKKNIAAHERAARIADPSTEEGKLEQEKSLAETRKTIVEAEKGAFDAAFPRGTTQPLEGKVEADEKSGYVAEIVGYKAMDECATAIAAAIDNAQLGEHPKILIVDSTNVVQGDMPLEQVRRQMRLIETELQVQKARLAALIPQAAGQPARAERAPEAVALPVPMAVGAATSVVSQLADLLSYFRSDYSLRGRVFAVSDTALTASIAGKIKNAETYLLNFYRLVSNSALIEVFEKILELRQTVEQEANEATAKVIHPKSGAVALSKLKVQQLQARLDAAEKSDKPPVRDQLDAEQANLAGLTHELEAMQAVMAAWHAASATIDTNLKAMVASGDQDKPPLLMQAVAREQTADMTHLLYVKVSSSGGESVTRRSLWPFTKQKVNYLGGGAVTYLLATDKGCVVAADTVTALGRVNYDLTDGVTNEGKLIFPSAGCVGGGDSTTGLIPST